jgi:hypothetical protein
MCGPRPPCFEWLMEQCSDVAITWYLSFTVPGREASFWIRGAQTVILNVKSCVGGKTSETTDHDVSFWRLSPGRQRFVQQKRIVSRSGVQNNSVENLATALTCAMLYFESHHTKREHFSFSISLLRYSWKLLRQLVIPSNCKAPYHLPK